MAITLIIILLLISISTSIFLIYRDSKYKYESIHEGDVLYRYDNETGFFYRITVLSNKQYLDKDLIIREITIRDIFDGDIKIPE